MYYNILKQNYILTNFQRTFVFSGYMVFGEIHEGIKGVGVQHHCLFALSKARVSMGLGMTRFPCQEMAVWMPWILWKSNKNLSYSEGDTNAVQHPNMYDGRSSSFTEKPQVRPILLKTTAKLPEPSFASLLYACGGQGSLTRSLFNITNFSSHLILVLGQFILLLAFLCEYYVIFLFKFSLETKSVSQREP